MHHLRGSLGKGGMDAAPWTSTALLCMASVVLLGTTTTTTTKPHSTRLLALASLAMSHSFCDKGKMLLSISSKSAVWTCLTALLACFYFFV